MHFIFLGHEFAECILKILKKASPEYVFIIRHEMIERSGAKNAFLMSLVRVHLPGINSMEFKPEIRDIFANESIKCEEIHPFKIRNAPYTFAEFYLGVASYEWYGTNWKLLKYRPFIFVIEANEFSFGFMDFGEDFCFDTGVGNPDRNWDTDASFDFFPKEYRISRDITLGTEVWKTCDIQECLIDRKRFYTHTTST